MQKKLILKPSKFLRLNQVDKCPAGTTLRAWWAVCAKFDRSFTATCWFAITNDSDFM